METHKIQALKSHQSKLKADLEDVRSQQQQLSAEEEVIELQLTAVELQLGNNVASRLPLRGNSKSEDSRQGDFMLILKGMGFRDAMRAVMRDSGRGLRPKDIAQALRRSDFEYTATVNISTRVSNELYNLKKAGHVKRNKGLYTLVQERG
jgi:hypothetical protein